MKLKDIVIMCKVFTWPIRLILIIFGVIPLTRCSSGYREENGKVMFNGKEITDKSFVVLSSEFAKDSIAAYYKGSSFQYADVATFEALDENYAKDKSKVYYCDEYREGQNYYMTKRQTIIELKNVNPASFVSLKNGYGKDARHAWFQGKYFIVKDIATLKSLDINFSKDDVQVYLNCIPIDGSDGKTFEITDRNFAKDKNHVYYYGFDGEQKYNIAKLPCDPQTFKIIDYRFSKDANKVFFLAFTIKDAEAASFEVLKAGYSKDRNAVFFQHKKIPGGNPLNFEVFKENESFSQDVDYAKDNTVVYVNDEKVSVADPATFKLLGENYASDKTHVFYKTKIVTEAKPGTFTVYPYDFGNADSEDGKMKFHEGKRVVEQ
ncbi:MAG: DKNYY domain-containing protein [Chitinophagaceae bacterium]